jgi:hypothetical protein
MLLVLLAAGSFDVSGSIGGATPFGTLELNHRSGILGGLAAGFNTGSSRLELAADLIHLTGSQQPDYALDNLLVAASYHYAFVRREDWQLRVGAGPCLSHLYRTLPGVRESGSVLGGTLALTYQHRFDGPVFQFQLFGTELLEFQRLTAGTNVVPALVLGMRIGGGYEFRRARSSGPPPRDGI